jgi:UDP-3-O-acyl-N-acetylglucosamine deacetylase
VLGRVEAERSGHGVHAALVGRVLRDDSAWEIIDSPALEASPEPLSWRAPF